MNDGKHGYGIHRWASGAVFYGQYKENNHEGLGYMKNDDGTEYYG